MVKVLILRADAYRMIDALRDYADILEAEGSGMVDFARHAADNIENAQGSEHNGRSLIEIERHDLDAAHSAVIGVMVARREQAESLRKQAFMLEAEANRFEALLSAF